MDPKICTTIKTIEICRVCVDEQTTITKFSDVVMEDYNNKMSISDVLQTFVNLKLNQNHVYFICFNCMERATEAYKFKVQCEKSNEAFENFLVNSVVNKPLYIENETKDVFENCSTNEDASTTKQQMPDVTSRYKEKSKDNEKLYVTRNVNKRKYLHKPKLTDLINMDSFSCEMCNKSFKNKYILLAHEKRHENKGQFLCSMCGKGFDAKSCLTRHIRVHTGEKKYECKVCNKRFPSANNLNLHSRSHSGVKPYLCTICGKSFSHPTGLTYHMRTHTKERPYTCEVCGKRFTIQCHLDRHKKIHSGEKPFACSQCDRAFIKKIDLQRHEATHSGEKPYTCNVCSKSFLRKLHLKYHIMVHTSERPHKCPSCGKGFIRRYYLKNHISKHHGLENP